MTAQQILCKIYIFKNMLAYELFGQEKHNQEQSLNHTFTPSKYEKVYRSRNRPPGIVFLYVVLDLASEVGRHRAVQGAGWEGKGASRAAVGAERHSSAGLRLHPLPLPCCSPTECWAASFLKAGLFHTRVPGPPTSWIPILQMTFPSL